MCFKDLRPYLDLVPSEEYSSLIQNLLDTITLEKADGGEIAFATDVSRLGGVCEGVYCVSCS